MKSVKMMSVLAAATLSLGTAACQMPLEEEDAILEQDAETLLAPGPGQGQACSVQVRGLAEVVFDERGIRIDWEDSCIDDDMTLALVTSENDPIIEGRHHLSGELLNDEGGGYAVSGSFSGLESDESAVSVEVIDEQGEPVGLVYIELMYDGSSELRADGKVTWF